ncbi:hypothetical protein GCM10010170_058730 [Dactylosporangium salmoneum]|uniref:Uncharacterized protein n=1 Tax=Dactylosporangium salmoneum TaxID=53361 RepID=A0ABN3GVV8_9ACTN
MGDRESDAANPASKPGPGYRPKHRRPSSHRWSHRRAAWLVLQLVGILVEDEVLTRYEDPTTWMKVLVRFSLSTLELRPDR